MSITTNGVVRAKYETARETAFGSITSSLTRIGSVFDAPFSIVYIHNYTDVYIDFSISYDGLSVCFTLEPGGKLTSDMNTNQIQISAGESAWCQYRTGAPTTGFVQVAAVTPV